MRRIGLFLTVVLVLGAGSCSDGGDDDGRGTSGVESSKRWSDMTDAERGALCDWWAEPFGGYGKSLGCGATTADSQQACVASVPSTCNATVSEMETCLEMFKCPMPLEGLNCLIAACN